MIFNEKKKKLTPRQFEAELERLVKWVRESVSPFENDTKGKQESRVRRAREDQDFFNHTYLPHYFKQPSPDFHRDMERLTETGEELQRPVAIAAPRNHAKSTRTTLARPLKKGLFKEKKFIVIIGNDETLAKGMTVSIRTELEFNPRIIHDFGKQKSEPWTHGNFVIKEGARFWARGIEQRIRGEKHGPYRPDMVVIDDPEDDEMQRNPQRIKNLVNWVLEAVYPSFEPESMLLYWVGTLLSKKSALATVMKNPEWLSKIYRAIENPVWDGEKMEFTAGTPIWPARFNLKKLSSIRKVIGSIAFNKEYQNNPTDDEAKIKEGWIKRVRFDEIDKARLYYYQALDPSLGEHETSDFQGHATVALLPGGRLALRHADIQKRSIDSMVKNCYLLQKRFMAVGLGLETIGFQKLLKRDFDREAKEQGRYLPIVPIDHHGVAKIPRVLRLSPLIEHGNFVYASGPEHEIGDMETMIEQFLYIEEASVHDDGPDAAEMACTLAEGLAGGKPSYERVAQREAHFGQGAW
ncbi:MAG TPA: hypothetical protein VNL14_14035 [Candidatus Acidoferrales bacterium]|nr:hypothetical protein [Candidatus Acidoferrales bacterium]